MGGRDRGPEERPLSRANAFNTTGGKERLQVEVVHSRNGQAAVDDGAVVWLKPTDFKNDQVVFTSYARGGSSLASPTEYYAAVLSPTLVSIAGIGGFTPVELDKLLPGRLVNVSPYVSSYTHGVSGTSTPRDLETAFQLLHLYFTAPNRTPEAFDLMKRRLQAVLANHCTVLDGAVIGARSLIAAHARARAAGLDTSLVLAGDVGETEVEVRYTPAVARWIPREEKMTTFAAASRPRLASNGRVHPAPGSVDGTHRSFCTVVSGRQREHGRSRE